MADSSISVAVRVRPFSAKESAMLAPQDIPAPFLGDGGLAGSPNKTAMLGLDSLAGIPASSGSNLRRGALRNIIRPVDDKVLIFDPVDTNPLSRLYAQPSHALGFSSKRCKDVRYAFDRVFPDTAGQRDVFESTTKPLLDGILNGYNASVFAYGATGCGKTHTISGTEADPGVVFLTMKELFDRISDETEEYDVQVRLSYLEIYNEAIRDLLSVEPTPKGQGLMLREDAANRISVVGITEHIPGSAEEVLLKITEGNRRRTMSPTEANAVSSRSHAVLQINVTRRPRIASTTEETTSASLNIIDLAGSERAAATSNHGARMKEGANINKSLLALGNCINALCQPGVVGARGRHVPYRNSKLTRLLKFSLGGNCKTVMIVCVSPSSAHYDETHNTLKYANQAKNIRTKVTRNMLNVDRHVAQYVQAIHELKEENAMLKSRLAERGNIESAGDKRKRMEMEKELDLTKGRMQDSTESVKRVVAEKSQYDAILSAAQIRLAPIRARLREVETELEGFSTDEQPTDLTSERDILRRLAAPDEAILTDAVIVTGAQNVANSLQMQHGIIVAASRNQKFSDTALGISPSEAQGEGPECAVAVSMGARAAEAIRTIGTSLLAEVNAAHAVAKYEALMKAYGNSASQTCDLVQIATRCTVALKETAELLEANSKEPRGADEHEKEHELVAFAKQLRDVSSANDEVFRRLAGQGTQNPRSGAARRPGPRVSSALRRQRNSLSAQVPVRIAPRGSTVSAYRAPPAASAARSRRLSTMPIAPRSSAQGSQISGTAMGAAQVSRLAHVVGSPRKNLRRQSVGGAGPRISGMGARTRVSLAPGLNKTSATAAAAAAASAGKKSFRWADEAGEGKIDDAGRRRAYHADSPVNSIAQHGGESSASASPVDSSPEVVVMKPVGRVAALRIGEPDGGSSGSGTEWEDYGTDTAANSSDVGHLPNPARGRASGRRQSSVFDRNFLVKKAVTSSSLGSVMEGGGGSGVTLEDEESEGVDRATAAPMAAPIRVRSRLEAPTQASQMRAAAALAAGSRRSVSATVPSSSRAPFAELANADLSNASSSAPGRTAPYGKRRRESNVGPIRRRGRTSSSSASGAGSSSFMDGSGGLRLGSDRYVPSVSALPRAHNVEVDLSIPGAKRVGSSFGGATRTNGVPSNVAGRLALGASPAMNAPAQGSGSGIRNSTTPSSSPRKAQLALAPIEVVERVTTTPLSTTAGTVAAAKGPWR